MMVTVDFVSSTETEYRFILKRGPLFDIHIDSFDLHVQGELTSKDANQTLLHINFFLNYDDELYKMLTLHFVFMVMSAILSFWIGEILRLITFITFVVFTTLLIWYLKERHFRKRLIFDILHLFDQLFLTTHQNNLRRH